MFNVLILAGGDGTRWKNYRGAPKHLVTIEGERLLNRTARQCLKYSSNVTIVGIDERYRVMDTTLFVPEHPTYKWEEMDKFVSSMHLWGEDKTILMFGDVYYTDEAVNTIMTNQSSWACFCRTDASKITGKNWKEIFAFSFDESEASMFREAITHLHLYEPKINSAGGWSLFRYLTFGNHLKPTEPELLWNTGRHVEIDDWTEDFDFPKDFDLWEKLMLSKQHLTGIIKPIN